MWPAVSIVQLDYLNVFTVRRGRKKLHVAYYRRGGVKTRLKDDAGKPVDPNDRDALVRAWQAAHAAYGAADVKAAGAADQRAVKPRSIAALILAYKASADWAQLKPDSQKDYLKGLKPLEDDWGNYSVAGMESLHVTRVRDKYAFRDVPDPDKPGETMRVSNAYKANKVVTVLSILMSFAVNPLGWRKDNPALRPKRLRIDTEGLRPWTEGEFLQFIDRADAEWQFNALFALLTTQRGQDQVKVGWHDYDGITIEVVQLKGRKTVKLRIEAHPLLKTALDRRKIAMAKLSPQPLTILRRPDGTPWKVNAFQKAAGVAIRAAGLTGITWHGLRASGTSWSADGGATDKMLQAMTGHKTSAMVSKYSRGADQQRLAASAVRAIVVPIAPKVDKRKGKKG